MSVGGSRWSLFLPRLQSSSGEVTTLLRRMTPQEEPNPSQNPTSCQQGQPEMELEETKPVNNFIPLTPIPLNRAEGPLSQVLD